MNFEKIRPRGDFYFSVTKFKGETLTVETPALITPTGIQSDKSRNWMDLELDVSENSEHQKLYDMFKMVDSTCIDETIQNLDKWFPKSDVDETFVEEQYKSPVTAGWGNEPALLRIEIGVIEPEDLMDSLGNVISPRDVTALSSVVVTLQLLGMWVSDKFLGCHWRATRIVANLDHEVKGRRRSSSPRRQSPLPPVTARGGRRNIVEESNPEPKQIRRTKQTESGKNSNNKPEEETKQNRRTKQTDSGKSFNKVEEEETKPVPKKAAPKKASANSSEKRNDEQKHQEEQEEQEEKHQSRIVKEDPKIQKMLDKLRTQEPERSSRHESDYSDSDSSDHRSHHRRRSYSDDDSDSYENRRERHSRDRHYHRRHSDSE